MYRSVFLCFNSAVPHRITIYVIRPTFFQVLVRFRFFLLSSFYRFMYVSDFFYLVQLLTILLPCRVLHILS